MAAYLFGAWTFILSIQAFWEELSFPQSLNGQRKCPAWRSTVFQPQLGWLIQPMHLQGDAFGGAQIGLAAASARFKKAGYHSISSWNSHTPGTWWARSQDSHEWSFQCVLWITKPQRHTKASSMPCTGCSGWTTWSQRDFVALPSFMHFQKKAIILFQSKLCVSNRCETDAWPWA